MSVPKVDLFQLVCEFNPPRQTCLHKFIGTYLSLTDLKHHEPLLDNKILFFSRASNTHLHAIPIRPTRPLVHHVFDTL